MSKIILVDEMDSLCLLTAFSCNCKECLVTKDLLATTKLKTFKEFIDLMEELGRITRKRPEGIGIMSRIRGWISNPNYEKCERK